MALAGVSAGERTPLYVLVLPDQVKALTGSYWGSKVAGRDRLRYERRVYTTETVLALLYEIGSDLAL